MKEFKIDLSMYDGKVREVVSEAVQKKAFELGYAWGVGGKKDGTLISAADFLALTPEDVQDAPKEPEFKPFDRVLVRDDDGDEWHIDFFEGMNKDKDGPYRYRCLNTCWCNCIPYEGNEHLLGTTEDVK